VKQVDMSAKAVTARLKRVAQLRRLSLSLRKAKLPADENHPKTGEQTAKSSQPNTRRAK